MKNKSDDKLQEARLKIIDLMKFIDHWSYCTRMGINRCCPEKKAEWVEQMKKLGAAEQ